jgi:hypothetical protein
MQDPRKPADLVDKRQEAAIVRRRLETATLRIGHQCFRESEPGDIG